MRVLRLQHPNFYDIFLMMKEKIGTDGVPQNSQVMEVSDDPVY